MREEKKNFRESGEPLLKSTLKKIPVIEFDQIQVCD